MFPIIFPFDFMQSGRPAVQINSVEDYSKALGDMIEQLDTTVKCDEKTKDLEKALGEYKRKIAKGELATKEQKRQYLEQHVASLADEVQKLESEKKKAAGK